MSSKKTKARLDSTPVLILFGLGDRQKPRAATLDKIQTDTALKLAQTMGLQWLRIATEEHAAVAAQLPAGRLYLSGTGHVPYVRQDLFARLVEFHAVARGSDPDALLNPNSPPIADGEKTEAEAPGDAASGEAQSAPPVPAAETALAGTLPTVFPPSWSTVDVGHLVVAHESSEDGWWEAIVVAKDEDMLTLRWRDYPKYKPFTRHRSTLALLCPVNR